MGRCSTGGRLLNYLEQKHGKQRLRIDNFGGNAQSRPRLNMGCSAIEEEEEGITPQFAWRD
jgi:hypothetical protein